MNRKGDAITATTTNGSGVLQQHVVILSSPTNEEEKEATIHMMTEEDGPSPLPLSDHSPPPPPFASTTVGDQKESILRKEGSSFFRPIEKCEETRMQYAKVGLDIHTIQRFKTLATALVVEKEAQMMEAAYLGNEKDIVMEESIECVPKNFLDEISQSPSGTGNHNHNHSTTDHEAKVDTTTADDIRVMSVGELLSLLEV